MRESVTANIVPLSTSYVPGPARRARSEIAAGRIRRRRSVLAENQHCGPALIVRATNRVPHHANRDALNNYGATHLEKDASLASAKRTGQPYFGRGRLLAS